MPRSRLAPLPDNLPHWSEFQSLGHVLERFQAQEEGKGSNHHSDWWEWIAPGKRGALKSIATLSPQQLHARAVSVALWLRNSGIEVGECVLLSVPPGFDWDVAFLGCVYAGCIAVPAYPPDPTRLRRDLPRFESIVKQTKPRIVLTDGTYVKALKLGVMATRGCRLPTGVKWHNMGSVKAASAKEVAAFEFDSRINHDSLCFIQFTSGSTADPKGVCVSHRNILQNIHNISRVYGDFNDCTAVYWLPQYHDMGLIGARLAGIYGRLRHVVFMSPLDFVRNPSLWLKVMSDRKAQITAAPNFAYDLCTAKVSPEGLDLSHMIAMSNAAEPIQVLSIENFFSKFKSTGLDHSVFMPMYGLAEATLAVTATISEQYHAVKISRHSYECEQQAVDANPEETETMSIVSCGPVFDEMEVCIVRDDEALPDNEIGEIWIAGPSKSQEYWGNPSATAEELNASLASRPGVPFLRTGDIGFLRQGELYISGRAKDLIIVRGRNIWPQDLEKSAELSDKRLRPGCVACFSLKGEMQDVVIGVVAEVRDPKGSDEAQLQIITEHIRTAIVRDHEVSVGKVFLVPPRAVLKTTSGKVRRRQTKQYALDDKLKILYTGVFMQHFETDSAKHHHRVDPEIVLDILPFLKADQIQPFVQAQYDEDDGQKAVSTWLSKVLPGSSTSDEMLREPWRHLPIQKHKLAEVTPAARATAVIQYIVEYTLSRELQLDAEKILDATSIWELGLDSLKSVQLRHALEENLSLTVHQEVVSQSHTAADMAEKITQTMHQPESEPELTWEGSLPRVPTILQYWLFDCSQLISIVLVALFILACAVPAVSFTAVTSGGFNLEFVAVDASDARWLTGLEHGQYLRAFVVTPVALVIFGLATLVLSTILKWLLLGRIKPGTHSLTSFYFLRLHYVERITAVANFFTGPIISQSPVTNIWFKSLGIRVDMSAVVNTDSVASAWDLVHIGARSNVETTLRPVHYSGPQQTLTMEPIVVGSGCSIGTSAVLEAGSHVFDDEAVTAWSFHGRDATSKQSHSFVKPIGYRLLEVLFTLTLWMITVGAAVLLPVWFIERTSGKIPFGVYSVPVSLITSYMLFQASQAALLLLLKWLLIGKFKAGFYQECSWFSLRRHALGRLHQILTRDLLAHLTCSALLALWYRLLGANVSPSAYLNTFIHNDFDLITIEDEVLLGGGAEITTSVSGRTLGESELRTCSVGKASVVGHKTKISVSRIEPGSKISPISFVTDTTNTSSTTDRLTNAACDVPMLAIVIRLGLQVMVFGLLFAIAVTALLPGHRLVRHVYVSDEPGIVIALALLLWMITFVLTVAAIDLVISRLLRCFASDKTAPILSAAGARFLLSIQLYNVTTNLFAVLGVIGTPLFVWYLRLRGAKVGLRTTILSQWLYDLNHVSIGERAIICHDATITPHDTQPRQIKVGRVIVGRRAVIGSSAALHGPLTVSQGVYLEPLSRPLCGEVLSPECSVWGGVPAACRYTEEPHGPSLITPEYDVDGNKFTTILLHV